MQNFFLCEKMSKQGEWKWKVDDVGVIGAKGDVLGSLKQVKGEREKQTYLKSLDDSMVVKAVDGVENGADDGDGVVLGRLSLCEDAVKGLSAGGKLKRG